ncbi:hypothetical protein MCERE19_03263 [Spirosomataceae bacterium]
MQSKTSNFFCLKTLKEFLQETVFLRKFNKAKELEHRNPYKQTKCHET